MSSKAPIVNWRATFRNWMHRPNSRPPVCAYEQMEPSGFGEQQAN